MRSRSLCATLTVAALAALTIAGCSAAPSPAPGPTSHGASATTEPPRSTPPVPTPTPTWPVAVALPSPPAEMSRDDEVGAVAAAEYFLGELYPYTVSSQNTLAWRAMSHELCTYCSSIAISVEHEAQVGAMTSPGAVTVINKTVEEANPLEYGARFELTVRRDVQRSAGGDVVSESPRQHVQLGIVLVWRVDHWLVRGVDIFSSEVIN